MMRFLRSIYSSVIVSFRVKVEYVPIFNQLINTVKPLKNELMHIYSLFKYDIVYSYCMPVCSIVKTVTPRCNGRPDALLHEAEGRVQ